MWESLQHSWRHAVSSCMPSSPARLGGACLGGWGRLGVWLAGRSRLRWPVGGFGGWPAGWGGLTGHARATMLVSELIDGTATNHSSGVSGTRLQVLGEARQLVSMPPLRKYAFQRSILPKSIQWRRYSDQQQCGIGSQSGYTVRSMSAYGWAGRRIIQMVVLTWYVQAWIALWCMWSKDPGDHEVGRSRGCILSSHPSTHSLIPSARTLPHPTWPVESVLRPYSAQDCDV